MRPCLERLEDRLVPSDFSSYGFDIQRISIPAQIVDPYSQLLWIRMGEWLGTSALGQRLAPGAGYHWGPNRIFMVEMTPAQAGAWGLGGTTGREPNFQIGNYLVPPAVIQPLIFASPGTDLPGSDGPGWEKDSIFNGWPTDWGGIQTANGINYDHALMPHGSLWGIYGQYGNTFANKPNYALADAVFAAEVFGHATGLPPWWYFA